MEIETGRPVITQVDLNRAGQDELAALPGIGPALARRIIRYREEVHPFTEAIEITAVPGVSEKMYRRFEDQVMVSLPEEPEPPPLPDAGAVAAQPEPAAAGIPETPAAPPPPAPEPEPPPRSLPPAAPRSPLPVPAIPPWWQSCLLVIAGIVGGAILALLILQRINGTLSLTPQSQAVELGDELSALKHREDTLQAEVQELRDRLHQMEALSGRLQSAETDIQTLQAALETLAGQLAALQEDTQQLQAGLETQGEELTTLRQDTDQIRQTVAEIEAATGRFDNFLTGLKELLLATEETPAATPTTTRQVTSTPTPTPTPRPTATPTPRP